MVDICEDYLKPCARRQECLLCEGSRGLQEGCRAGIWCALAEVDHQLPTTWTAYLSMRQEIRDPQVHHQLQKDLIEHLWRLKGDAA